MHDWYIPTLGLGRVCLGGRVQARVHLGSFEHLSDLAQLGSGSEPIWAQFEPGYRAHLGLWPIWLDWVRAPDPFWHYDLRHCAISLGCGVGAWWICDITHNVLSFCFIFKLAWRTNDSYTLYMSILFTAIYSKCHIMQNMCFPYVFGICWPKPHILTYILFKVPCSWGGACPRCMAKVIRRGRDGYVFK